jgi:hypothetical protein
VSSTGWIARHTRARDVHRGLTERIDVAREPSGSGVVGQVPAVTQVGRVTDGDEQPVLPQQADDCLAPGLGARLMQQLMSALV